MTLCSVIIPVYNTKEEYLRRCLDHFREIQQDIEAVIVNDGSNEATVKILQEYAELPAVRLYTQENHGVSAARNRGMEEARGTWIIFSDADDEVDTEVLRDIISHVQEDTDYVYTDFRKIRRKEDTITFPEMTSPDAYIHQLMCHPNQYGTVWSKLYRKSVIDKNHIRFREELTHAEDTVFLLEYLMESQKIMHSRTPFYTYRFYPASASKTSTEAAEKYIRSMEVIRDIYLDHYHGDIRDYGSYCNTNLMIILANYVCTPNKPYGEVKKQLQNLLEKELFSSTLRNYRQEETDLKQKVTVWLMQRHMYYPVDLIFRIYRYIAK